MRVIGILPVCLTIRDGQYPMVLMKKGTRFFVSFKEGNPIIIRLTNLFDRYAETYQCE